MIQLTFGIAKVCSLSGSGMYLRKHHRPRDRHVGKNLQNRNEEYKGRMLVQQSMDSHEMLQQVLMDMAGPRAGEAFFLLFSIARSWRASNE